MLLNVYSSNLLYTMIHKTTYAILTDFQRSFTVRFLRKHDRIVPYLKCVTKHLVKCECLKLSLNVHYGVTITVAD